MKYSYRGENLTKQFEADGGPRLIAYQDSGGVWTIAWGHTRGVHAGMTCTLDQAEQWFDEDLAGSEANVNAVVRVTITQHEYDALVDFDFNCGSKNLDSSTLLLLVNQNKMEEAALEFEKWDHCQGKVVAGLLRRRKAEEEEFLTPDEEGDSDGT